MSKSPIPIVENSPIATRVVITLAAFVIVTAGMSAAQSMLVPFLLALFISIISAPLLTWFHNKGLPRLVAMLCVLLVIIAIGLAIAALVGTSLNRFIGDIPFYQDRLSEMTGEAGQWLHAHGIEYPADQLRELVNPGAAVGLAGRLLTSLGGVLTNAFLIVLVVVFMLMEGWSFPGKLKLALGDPVNSMERFQLFLDNLQNYMAIKTIISLITGVVIGLWLVFLGVDYALMWGVFAFLLNFIPTIGSIIAAVPVVLLALVQLGASSAALVAFGYLVVNVLMGNIVEPRTMGRGLGLSPLVVFLSLIFWGWVLGPVGMLLSAPLTMTLKIALDSSEETRWLAIMLGPPVAEAKPEPSTDEDAEQDDA